MRWIREVLAQPEGGYGASQDADVGLDDDGDYFTWTREEAAAVLDEEELALLSARYDIGTAGEMHHNPSKNVLFVSSSLEESAAQAGVDAGRAAAVFASGRSKLISARAARRAPYVDTSIYTNWNAMLAGALLQAAPLLDDTWARDHALLTLDRLRREAAAPDALGHVSGGPPLLLDDQVQTARAALDAAALTGDAEWVSWAVALMDQTWETFSDPEQPGLLDTPRSRGGEGLLSTPARSIQDAPTPAPNAIAAITCARLAEWTGEARWGERRNQIAGAFGHRAGALGLHAAALLMAVDWQVSPPTHLVVTGSADDPEASRMHRSALAAFLPRSLIRRLMPGRAEQE
ncbi:MAG: thioredoxin domain-containing protein, partial [Gemmatimonadales bacterium]